jgi:hypothetical protein
MKIFFDTEFIEDGRTIDLISIGLVREDGRALLYFENSECDLSRADPWVVENVISKLQRSLGYNEYLATRKQIAQAIKVFVGPKPEFWAYYADYDWVVLCQLYGRMIDLPEGWPKFCLDLKQILHMRGIKKIPKPLEKNAHNALSDALWLREAFMSLGKT